MEKECAEVVEVAEGPSICASEQKPTERHAAAVRQESAYGIKVWVEMPFDDVLAAARRALDEEGFRVVSDLDVRELFEGDLGVRYPEYRILGVVHPELSQQALDLDRDAGLLIPLNLVVYEQHEGSTIEAVDPIALFSLAGNSDLDDLARTIKARLQDVVDHVAAGLDQ